MYRYVREPASVVDPNTLNLDPDPELWPNLDPNPDKGPDPGLCYKFLKKNLKINLEKNMFLTNLSFFKL